MHSRGPGKGQEMPFKDIRTPVATKPKMRTAGKRVVSYVDSKGRSTNCVVLGAGTSSGLKLLDPHKNLVRDNVAVATGMGSVNCYRAR